MAYMWYAFATIYPVNLAALYPYPATIPIWQSALAAAGLLAITAWVFLRIRTQPYLFVGWCWFIGTLVPVIGLVQIGSPPHSDRYMYLPAIGVFLMAAWAVEHWARVRTGWTRAIVALVLVDVVIAAVLTSRQVAHWKNDVTLWQHAVAVTDDNYRAQTNLGFALATAGDRPRALDAYTEAIRLNPRYPNAHNYLGLLWADAGEHDRAAVEYEAALALSPRFVEAHNNLGLTRAAQDRMPQAIAAFETARRLNPSFAAARSNLGIAYAREGQLDRAVAEFSEAVRLSPSSPESRINLATALDAIGRTSEAIAELRIALRVAPDHAAAREMLQQLLKK
jgi:tetratricopeptide (TPR) repeat protein